MNVFFCKLYFYVFFSLDYEEFADIVSLLEMTDDYDTIARLFTALLPHNQHQNCMYSLLCISSYFR